MGSKGDLAVPLAATREATGACNGGKGGAGGRGGSGGGGLGGHSLAVGFVGTPPVLEETSATAGAEGQGGLGGDGNAAISGANGQSCQSLDFESGTCTNG